MNIYVRILFGYGYLVALLVTVAAGAALGFHQLSEKFGQAMIGNAQRAQAATAMLKALDHHDQAVRALIRGESSRQALTVAQLAFESALEGVMLSPSTEFSHTAQASSLEIRERFSRYRTACEAWLSTPGSLAFDQRMWDDFTALKHQVHNLMEANYQAEVKIDEALQQAALRRALLYGFLVTVALLSLGYLSRALRSTLDRLTELADLAQALARGERHRRAAVGRSDELGQIARQLNAALDNQLAAEGEMRGRLAQERQLTLALLAKATQPGAVFSLVGDPVASTLTAQDNQQAQAALREFFVDQEVLSRAAASGPATAKAEPWRKVRENGVTVTLESLAAPGGCPIGWWATVTRVS